MARHFVSSSVLANLQPVKPETTLASLKQFKMQKQKSNKKVANEYGRFFIFTNIIHQSRPSFGIVESVREEGIPIDFCLH